MSRIARIAALVLFVTLGAALAAQVAVGGRLPDLSITTGDGQVLSTNDLKGKLVVLLYETKELKELNRPLKDRLAALSSGLTPTERGHLARVPVVDASSAFWPFTSIWQDNLVRNSASEGLAIYGDWNGSLKKALGFSTDAVYVVVVDSGGTVRWQKKGRLEAPDVRQLEELLTTLLKESR